MLDRILEDYELSWDGEKIVQIARTIDNCEEIIDAAGRYLAPGFIDRHVHGGWGFDFEKDSVERILTGANEMAEFGCTALFPSTNTSFIPSEADLASLDRLEKAISLSTSGVELLGIHVEGAFMMAQALESDFVLSKDAYTALLERAPHATIWTVDPEVEGAIDFVAELATRGLYASIGHTDNCTWENFVRCIECGATQATHLYSSTSGYYRDRGVRYPGAIESALMCPDIVVEVLTDECHVSAELFKYIYHIKGPDKIIIATDCHARSEKLMPNTKKVELKWIEQGKRYAWVGSPTMDDIVRGAYRGTDIPLYEVIRMATTNVARSCGCGNRKGLLCPGFDADLVLFDDDIHVSLTICRGETVFEEVH